jgi:YVTN family beta-propeller protein
MTISSYLRPALVAIPAIIMSLSITAAGPAAVRIIQTNSAGDSVDIIDAATNKVIASIQDIERSHGAQSSPDGKWIYVTNESTNTVDIVDGQTMKVTKKVPLSGHPNNLGITPDGRKLYVAIAQAPGALDVIDTAKQAKVTTISVHGGVHNAYVTPDGKYAIAGMIGARNITVVDTKTDMPVWAHYFDLGVRPMTFEVNPDGSTKRIYAQLSNFDGFAVLDFQTQKEVARIKYPPLPAGKKAGVGGNAAHGIEVTPDGKTLVANSTTNSAVYFYSVPDLKFLGGLELGLGPNWVTTTPDSKFAYVSLDGENSVAVVDIKAMKLVSRIKVGQVPKRNETMLVAQ